ncbi:MAG: MmcB family DNA repair protein [Gelidibacter sp.]|nr:MmcB family DNA repair protein [Gelidibacter sp.]
MITLEMEVAIMQYFGVRQNCIVPNVSWGLGIHECDLLVLSKNNYATEVEIKISKSDLLKDKEKIHRHHSPKIARLFFAVPEKLKEVAEKHIPDRAGLLVVHKNKNTGRYVVFQHKCPKRNSKADKWSESEKINLQRLGVMRIFTMKKQLLSKFTNNSK